MVVYIVIAIKFHFTKPTHRLYLESLVAVVAGHVHHPRRLAWKVVYDNIVSTNSKAVYVFGWPQDINS